jgi:chloramphenicol 3-O-phosphotransferase
MNTNNPYMNVSLELVAEYISPEAAWTASSIRNTNDGLDPEVDVMVMIQALYTLAASKGMTKVTGALEEAFDGAYDHFLENNYVDETPDMYEDEATWL